MKILLMSIIIILVIIFASWWLPYKYNDCIEVGHTKTYCIIQLGR